MRSSSSPKVTPSHLRLRNICTTSVQREGTDFQGKDTKGSLAKLKEPADEAHDTDGLTALVCDTSARARWLGTQLRESARVMGADDILPLRGAVVLDLSRQGTGIRYGHRPRRTDRGLSCNAACETLPLYRYLPRHAQGHGRRPGNHHRAPCSPRCPDTGGLIHGNSL